VEVRPREGFWMTNRSASSLSPDGRFEIRAVAPGSYILTAAVFGPDGSLLARQPLEVGSADISGLELQLTPGIEVKGRVRAEAGELNLTSLRPQLQPRAQNMSFGGGGGEPAKEDGTFSVRNVAPDEYTVNVFGVPDGWYIKAVRFGEQEVLFTGIDLSAGAPGILDILLSPSGAQVDGIVADSDGKPLEGVTVALVPETDRRGVSHLYRSTTTDRAGRFSLRGLTPGEYRLLAWEQVEPGAYLDPDFLQPFESKGERVSLMEGERESKQLKAIPAQP
jgi:hypothetical protein